MVDLKRSVIKDSITLPVPAQVLYESYLDPAKHAEITGTPVTIGAQPGSPFSAFGGALSGTTLVTIPCRLVVQSWRSINFKPDDPDSTLILNFVPEGYNGRIDLVQLDVPEVDFQGVTEGWEKFYWTPWRRYLGQ
jgi:activator of HSP90 ATPase